MKKICTILAVLFLTGAFSQSGNIRGFVYAKETGEPLLFTTVYLQGTGFNASTDDNGFFSITKLPAGTYVLKIQSAGRDTSYSQTKTISATEILNVKLYVEKDKGIILDTVTIHAGNDDKQFKTDIVENIDAVKISKLPSVGEPDLAQYLQILPGVVFTGDQGGQLYIRGGSPIQNKVLLDGMIVYNPFHSIGLFSVFDSDIIRNAEVHSAAFGAEYGGRVSSIMDISTRDGNKKRVAGKVAGSPFGAKVLVEGPLKKLREDGNGSSSFLFSAKTSYLPTTSKVVYSYVDPKGLPFSFNDYYGKMNFNSGNGSKLNVFGFNFNDKVNYEGIAKFQWKSYGAGSNFVLIPNGSNVLVEGNFAYSQYKIDVTENQDTVPKRSSDINGFNMGFKFTNFIGKNEVKYGFEMIGFKTNFSLVNSANRTISQEENTTEIAGFVTTKMVSKNKKIIFEPSFRGHYYASLSNFSPEPRAAFKYNFNKKFRFKAAGGFYSQNLISANSDRDVVNLFYGFLSGSDNLPEKLTDQDGTVRDRKHSLQKSNHLLTGFEIDLIKNFEIKVEAYQKVFTQLTNLNRDKIYDDTPANYDKPDYQKKDFIIETGTARGCDFVVKYDRKHFYFWVIYSLTFNKRWDGIREYPPVFDRRHNINLVSSYTFGKTKNWEVNARWNYGSGFPFTPTQGYFPSINGNQNAGLDLNGVNGSLGYIPGPLNSQRLPDYHRLDLSVKWKYRLFEHTTLEVTAGATNTYNRKNIFYRSRNTGKKVYQLPFLPNLNVSFTF
ncbi:MAG: carboxypeptidase-like regulatory domain-containing protein [Bacteroidia bacterium]|nr:carboxypeptidase-like regulatory domain-containing protein [Bacteroidia bacterium]